ncbi:MAG TPA: amino acid ABC transporter permease [Candidatus Limnocylindria bacterium]|nr:amino acid ABC transporter permease [Candidatus Limnocylindria bacterium]
MYQWNWEVIASYKYVFVQGALVTLWLSLLVIALGTLLGLVLAFGSRSRELIVVWPIRIYVILFRTLPVLVLLIWVYYVLPILFGWNLSAFAAATIALSLHLSAFVSEALRSGIESVASTQYESAMALGFSPWQTMLKIILPQAIKNITPNLLGLYINEVKNSSLASIIAVNELLHRSNILISNTFRPLEIYTTVAVVYILILLPLGYLAHKVEIKFSAGRMAIKEF